MDWFPEVLGNVMVAGDKETAAFEAVPVPVSVAVCGEFVALSAIDSVALSAPTIDGVNTTETVHEVDGGTEAPQLFVWLKSLAFVPVKLNTGETMPPVPLSLKVTVSGLDGVPSCVDGNVRAVGASAPVAVPWAPVPLRAAVTGEPDSLPAMEREAVSALTVDGVNFTLMLHVDPAATEVQVFVCEKSAAFVPVKLMAEGVKVAVPVFWTAIV